MVEKSKIVEIAREEPYHDALYLLAWARFLTYKELEEFGYLEVYDAETLKGKIKSEEGWDKLVVPYNKDNVKKVMCISLYRAIQNYYKYDMDMRYIDDVFTDVGELKFWLMVLEDKDFGKVSEDYESVKAFYNNISKKYKFGLSL